MNKMEIEQVFTDAEYRKKIKQAELRLEKVRIASIEYLEKLPVAGLQPSNLSKVGSTFRGILSF